MGEAVTAAPNAYDAVAYPTMLFRHSQPDRLAAIARLHGLAPADIATAHVLEIGGGDGLNAIALAAAFPNATFVNFDLAEEPVARGRRWSAAAGLGNVRHEVLDILEAAERLGTPFDYIFAHGIYAWVPDAVRAAVMPLIGRLLSPDGVALVSYNALPGGHTRMALRQMLFHHLRDVTDPRARIDAARGLLRGFVGARDGDEPITAAMRREAEAPLRQPDGLFYHDLLSGAYAPQRLIDVVADTDAHGLRYLGDAARGGLDQGFVDPDKAGISDARLVDALQARDDANGRYFRTSLFVRAEARVARAIDSAAARPMWASTEAEAIDDGTFRTPGGTIRPADPRVAAILARLAELRPGRLPVAALADDPTVLARLCHLGVSGVIDLHTVPAPFAAAAGPRPVASPLARTQIAAGDRAIATLDHRMIAIDDEGLRRLVPLLDGSHVREALSGHMLDQLASKALLLEQFGFDRSDQLSRYRSVANPPSCRAPA